MIATHVTAAYVCYIIAQLHILADMGTLYHDVNENAKLLRTVRLLFADICLENMNENQDYSVE
jgi:hypothetical protein